jgi:hypothetical protein
MPAKNPPHPGGFALVNERRGISPEIPAHVHADRTKLKRRKLV